jgi:type II secretory pathway pseudopilin PulG
MTLIELIISISLFTMLGGMVVVMLNQMVTAWRSSEARRQAFDEAQTLLRLIRDDVRHTITSNPATPNTDALARLVADIDPWGRQRLTLVRTTPRETRHPLAPLAGTALGADADLDGINDRVEGFAGRLKATGGLMEVIYAIDPAGGVLLRGTRSPVGGAQSLFSLARIDNARNLRAIARPLSSRVLHLGLAYWTQHTDSWEGTRTFQVPVVGQASGPLAEWDSTRGLLQAPEDLDREEWHTWKGEASLRDPSDDIFPERIRVILVVEENPPAAPWTFLMRPLAKGAREMHVEDASRFERRLPWVLVDREWMRCRLETDTLLKILERGGRGTQPADHKMGADVVTGRTFESVVELPGTRESWDALD